MISEAQYKASADRLKVNVATVKAVKTVESGGVGLIDGKPVILFEPHIFWKRLKKHGIDPVTVQQGNQDILYPVWGTRPYPQGQKAQQARLDRAVKIHREAALESCSWGLFQIMGFNYAATGCKTIQEFVNRNYKSEDDQLDLFVNYILNEGLDDELRERDWAGFALAYNGPSYRRNMYDINLKKAYLNFLR